MAVDLSEYSEDAVNYIHHHLLLKYVAIADFSEALGIKRGTWYGWKLGTTMPSKETWRRVLRVARRFGVT